MVHEMLKCMLSSGCSCIRKFTIVDFPEPEGALNISNLPFDIFSLTLPFTLYSLLFTLYTILLPLFLTPEEFKAKIAEDAFVEYEEVYTDRFYGTLKSQVENQINNGENVVFDVDVKGGCNLKKIFGSEALSVFVQPPSVEELRRRLVGRATDAPEVIEQRLAKAEEELTYAPKFDVIIVNDDLETAKAEALKTIGEFLGK